jgi:hypothetical protein
MEWLGGEHVRTDAKFTPTGAELSHEFGRMSAGLVADDAATVDQSDCAFGSKA